MSDENVSDCQAVTMCADRSGFLDSSCAGLAASGADVTWRREAVLRPGDLSATILRALDAARAIAFVWDIAGDAVHRLRSGEASLQARGASFQRLADIVSRIVPGDRERFHASVAAALADPHGLFSGEYRIRRADGAIRWRSDRGTVER